VSPPLAPEVPPELEGLGAAVRRSAGRHHFIRERRRTVKASRAEVDQHGVGVLGTDEEVGSRDIPVKAPRRVGRGEGASGLCQHLHHLPGGEGSSGAPGIQGGSVRIDAEL
jgi:hypothetical protein